jgi:hypothetical protein
VKHGVLRLRLVSQAHHFRLAAGDGADVEGLISGCLCGGIIAAVFEVEPIVPVPHAEDVSLDVFIVSPCSTEPSCVKVEVDQAALDVEQTVGCAVLASMQIVVRMCGWVLTDLKVFDKSKLPLRTESSLEGGQMSAIAGHVRMSTPSRSDPREMDNACEAAVEPSARCTCLLSERPLSSQHSTDGVPSGVRTKAVTRVLPLRGSSGSLC